MPGGIVTGLFGKLPAHGDFIRRGGPPAVLAALDVWLERELGRVAGETPDLLPDGYEALDGWRFAAEVAGHPVIGTLVASGDGVGRFFPLIATAADDGIDRAGVEDWCGAAAHVLAAGRDEGVNADDVIAALSAIAPPPAGGERAAGWWRADDEESFAAGLPTGADFDRLFAGQAA